MGVYLLLPEGKVKIGVIDLDDKDGTAEPDVAPIVQGARLVDAAENYGLTMFLERSGGGLGAHVWLLLEYWTRAAEVREVLHGLVRATGIKGDVEVFPKQDVLGADGLGSLVALPFQGPGAMSEGRSMFYDSDSLTPIVESKGFNTMLVESYQLLKRMKRARVIPSVLDEARRRLKYEGHITKKAPKRPMAKVKGREDRVPSSVQPGLLKAPVTAVFRGCEALRAIRDAAKGKVRGSAKHGLGHAERLFLASVLRGLPGGREAIHKSLSGCADYDKAVTDYHLDSLKYGPWRCVTAQEYGVCEFEGTCPALRSRGGKSPVAFAYMKRPMKPQRGVEWRPLDENSTSTQELEKKVQTILKREKQG